MEMEEELKKYEEMSLEYLELEQSSILDELQEVNNELELFEEDYMPDLEEQKKSLERRLKKVNKQISVINTKIIEGEYDEKNN